jgi:uncharacterized protein
VTKNKYPLRINIGFMLNQPVGASRDFEFEFDQVQLPPDLNVTHFSGVARISKVRQGLLVDGDFKGTVETTCIRCLGIAETPLHTQFQELYTFKNFPAEESGLVVPDDGYIDIGPVVGEYLIVEIPISTLCREDCQGLCSFCGANLNDEPAEAHVHEGGE